jgi:hypothetical protein
MSPAKQTRLKSRDPGSFKGLLIRMNLEGWRSLRILAAETDATLNAQRSRPLMTCLRSMARNRRLKIRWRIKLGG